MITVAAPIANVIDSLSKAAGDWSQNGGPSGVLFAEST